MARNLRAFAAVGGFVLGIGLSAAALAQKPGGVLKIYTIDSPASMSIHEEATVFAERPMMPVFNNLVMFDQHVPQNSLQSIVPDLAASWAWDEGGTLLTFKLHEGVRWHDGRPFTAQDVKCTWDLLLGISSEKLRVNPRRVWYRNLDAVTTSERQMPQAVCTMAPTNVSRNLLVNRDAPPFDNAELRRAMVLALDRKAFIDIITEGEGDIGGVMQPPPEGLWGMPADVLQTLPGYGADV